MSLHKPATRTVVATLCLLLAVVGLGYVATKNKKPLSGEVRWRVPGKPVNNYDAEKLAIRKLAQLLRAHPNSEKFVLSWQTKAEDKWLNGRDSVKCQIVNQELEYERTEKRFNFTTFFTQNGDGSQQMYEAVDDRVIMVMTIRGDNTIASGLQRHYSGCAILSTRL